MSMYTATATLPDGSRIEKTGTIDELVMWYAEIKTDNPTASLELSAIGD